MFRTYYVLALTMVVTGCVVDDAADEETPAPAPASQPAATPAPAAAPAKPELAFCDAVDRTDAAAAKAIFDAAGYNNNATSSDPNDIRGSWRYWRME